MPSKKKKSAQKAVGYVVPHTHWDREWRYPLWKNRLLLVEVLDEMLETLEKEPEYRCFVTDGQVILIEDYLAVRPENAERLTRQVKAGRLSIGPWYTLPDLYPLDGECLVRNLLKGTRVSARYGGHLTVGYNTFGWGQTAQFPQIYHGFDINYIIAAKKVSHERAPDCEFLWEAPDGTRLITTRLGPVARANLYFHASLAIRFGMEYGTDEYRLPWNKTGVIIHNASPEKCHEDYFRLSYPREYYPERIEPGFRKAWSTLDETLVPERRLIMDGSDFTGFQPELPKLLADARERFEDIDFVNARFEDYFREFEKRVDRSKLKVVRGELRDGQACQLSSGALAVRIYIKMLNKQAESTVIRSTEPLASVMAMEGCEYPSALLHTCWEYFLQSHPHDSINGVTQDKTADDVVNRLTQVIEIGQVLREKSVGELVSRLDLSGYDENDVLLVFVNTSAHPMSGVVKAAVDFPQEFGVWDFTFTDHGGKPRDVQILSREEKTCPINDMAARPWPFYFDRFMTYIDPGEIPAGGYKVLKATTGRTNNRLAEWWPPMRAGTGRELSRAPATMENEFLKVTVNPDGTLTLVDKINDVEMPGLHYFEDSGDVGDYWAYYPPYDNRIQLSTTDTVRISRIENGDLAATMRVDITMSIPASGFRPEAGIRGESRRSRDTVELHISSIFTLKRGSPVLDVRTVVDNNAQNHRLRLMLPTGIAATHSDAAGHFTVDRRPVQPVRNPDGTFWPDTQTVPMQRFVDVSDGKRGFAVVNNCFTEFEALRDEDHTLAITLFRSVDNRICTEGRSTGSFPMQKGSHSLRTMTFEYGLYPHTGDWVGGDVYRRAEPYTVPPVVYQTSAHARGDLPAGLSFYSVSNANLVLSTLKKAEDRNSWIARLYNPTGTTQRGVLKFHRKIKRAWETNLNEKRGKALSVSSSGVRLQVPRGRIVTVEIVV